MNSIKPDTSTIKAIETHYKGYRFRSRLEARWAVFFDQMGAPDPEWFDGVFRWEYEPEVFHLPNGSLYLPDFRLIDWDCWVEVKGQTATKEDRSKCMSLGYGTGRPVLLLQGAPGDAWPELFCSDLTDSSGGENWWVGRFGFDLSKKPGFEVNDDRDREYMGPGMIGSLHWVVSGGTHNSLEYSPAGGRQTVWSREDFLFNPAAIARSARFEHGERP